MRYVFAAAIGLALLAIGLLAGLALGRKPETAAPMTNTISNRISFAVDDPKSFDPPEKLDKWVYPGSRVKSYAQEGPVTLGPIQLSGLETECATTPDDFEKVWGWYREQFQLRDDGQKSVQTRAQMSGDTNGVIYRVFDDPAGHSFQIGEATNAKHRAFAVKTLRYTVVGFLFREQAAKVTAIFLSYRPQTESLGLMKHLAPPLEPER